jgi:AcrR family transcriptional regulator
MTVASPASPQTSSTRVQILDAVISLFAKTGYFGTSMRAIAAEVGIGLSSLYNHYPSKQDILFEIMQQTMLELEDDVSKAIESVPADDPSAALRALVKAHVMFHGSHRQEALISDSELPALEPANRALIVELRDRYDARLREILRAGQAAGVFSLRNINAASFAIMSMCNGVAQWYKTSGTLSLEEIAEEYAILAQHGIAAPS